MTEELPAFCGLLEGARLSPPAPVELLRAFLYSLPTGPCGPLMWLQVCFASGTWHTVPTVRIAVVASPLDCHPLFGPLGLSSGARSLSER